MCMHEEKYCPRCGQLFECKAGSILLCHCSKITLTDEQKKLTADQYDDCLCAGCLQQIKNNEYIHQGTTAAKYK